MPDGSLQLTRSSRKTEYADLVCLIDDDESIRRAISRLLDSDGFKVRAFGDPNEFLKYLAQSPVRVAILDIWMAGMTGMELFAHLRSLSPGTRVIFITGYEDPAAETSVMQGGAFAFLMKPLDDEAFLSAVHRAFQAPIKES